MLKDRAMIRKSIWLLAFIALGCQENEPKPTVNDLSDFAMKYLSLRSGSLNSASMSQNGAMTQSFNGAYQGAYGPSAQSEGGVVTSDSSIVGPPEQSCGTFTEIDNPDGSHTSITDYGKGCTFGEGDYEYEMWGKMTSTTKYTDSREGSLYEYTYLYRGSFDHFGGRNFYNGDTTDWETNGTYSYEGYSEYDTSTYKYSGWYNNYDSSDYHYGDDEYSYQSAGKTTYDQNKSVVEQNSYSYTEGDNYYRSDVIKPLVMDYSCNIFSPRADGLAIACPIWMFYVSGTEVVNYRQDGKEGSFTIDYGDGTCDAIIVVTENGVSVTIDLSKDWGPVALAGAAQAGAGASGPH